MTAIDTFGEQVVGHRARRHVMEAIVSEQFGVSVNLRIKLWMIVIALMKSPLTLPIAHNNDVRNGEPVTGAR